MTSSISSYSIPYAYAKQICSRVLELDKSIRFAGIANNMGSLVVYRLREGVVPLLNEEELQSNIMKTVLRMKTREDYESKLGDVIYTFFTVQEGKEGQHSARPSKFGGSNTVI
jgi:hypothetical protein